MSKRFTCTGLFSLTNSGRLARIAAATCISLFLFICIGCGSKSSTSTNGPLTGNWQLNLTQNYPTPSAQLSASGFLVQASNSLTGSVQGPVIIGASEFHECGGQGPLTGTISGQDVTFSLTPGGATLQFAGAISSDNTSMSGTYQGLSGACYNQSSTSGTFTAQLVPPLNGSFTGTLNSGNYMEALNGSTTPVPVSVSGSFTQSPNADSSSATLTGTITAAGYPCFTTASMVGTISGQAVYLAIYSYNGQQIGTIGTLGSFGLPGSPATVELSSSGMALTDSNPTGFDLNISSPCPAVNNPTTGFAQTTDFGSFTLTLD